MGKYKNIQIECTVADGLDIARIKALQAKVQQGMDIDDVIIKDCDAVNAFYGRNNSGKSTILHALDMAGLALSTRNWNQFQPKLEITDMFHEAGPFEIELTYDDGRRLTVRQQTGGVGPIFDPQPAEEQ